MKFLPKKSFHQSPARCALQTTKIAYTSTSKSIFRKERRPRDEQRKRWDFIVGETTYRTSRADEDIVSQKNLARRIVSSSLQVILGHPSFPRLALTPLSSSVSPFPQSSHPARIRIRARTHMWKIGPCRRAHHSLPLHEKNPSPGFYFTRLPRAGDDGLFLVTGRRAGTATKDRFQQPAMNSLKGKEEP